MLCRKAPQNTTCDGGPIGWRGSQARATQKLLGLWHTKPLRASAAYRVPPGIESRSRDVENRWGWQRPESARSGLTLI